MPFTVEPIETGATSANHPEFVEVPEAMHLFGIRRTSLYNLLRSGAIKGVLLRRPGRQTGKRLIHAASVRNFLMAAMEEQGGYTAGICNALPMRDKTNERKKRRTR